MHIKNNQGLLVALPVLSAMLSILAIALWGLKPGIDIAGGSMLQVQYEERPSVSAVHEALGGLSYGEIRVQESGDTDFILRQREMTGTEKQALMDALATVGAVEEVQFNSIGPSIGSELVRKAWWATGLVFLSIICYIAFAFRHVSKPVSSWKYGLVAIVTLIHDVLVPVGLYAYLGYAYGAEVGVFFIVAVLTVLGVSINDTIVIFDRIRENLRINEEKHIGDSFREVVWKSIVQTIGRSINTSVTVVIMLVALFFLGPESTRDFSLTLIVGIVAGTYSSILLSSPLLVYIERRQKQVTPSA